MENLALRVTRNLVIQVSWQWVEFDRLSVMDYLIFAIGLFLLAAALGAFFVYRERPSESKWLILAGALLALSGAGWARMVDFVTTDGPSVIGRVILVPLALALLGSFSLASLEARFALSWRLKWFGAAFLAVASLLLGLEHSNMLGLYVPSAAFAAWSGWLIAADRWPRRNGKGWLLRGLVAAAMLVVVLIQLVPDLMDSAFDVHGEGLALERVLLLSALAAAVAAAMGLAAVLWISGNRFGLMLSSSGGRGGLGGWLAVAGFILTICYGAWLSDWLGKQAHAEQTSTLLSAIKLGVSSMDGDAISGLDGSALDIDGEGYGSLRTKLMQIREALPRTRFVYLVGIRSGRPAFLVDAEDMHSPDFSPPGQVVERGTGQWWAAMNGVSDFVGPQSDEWGVWFTASLPVYGRDGRTVVGALGVDYSARDWLRPLAARRLSAMGGTLSVCCLLLTVFSFHLLSIQNTRRLDLLALVAKRTDNAVVITDPEGYIKWVNDGFTRISGYTMEESVGRRPGEILQRAEDHSPQRALMSERVRSGQGFETEVLNHSKDGRPYLIHIECQPLLDQAGRHMGFMAIERDVTRERRSANLLEAAAKVSASLLSPSPLEELWTLILQSLGSAADVSVAGLYRHHPHPVTGEPAMTLVSEWRPAGRMEAAATELHDLSFSSCGLSRWHSQLKEGREIAGPVSDFDGEERRILAALGVKSVMVLPIQVSDSLWGFLRLDVTREARVWESWEISVLSSVTSNIGLRLVASQESDALLLARDMARDAARSAEKANRAKSTFLATMSHEIRTPLNAVIGMASLLETTVLNPQQQDYAETILRSGHFLLGLINDILDYSRIESGKIDLDASPISLLKVCHESFDVVRVGAIGKKLEMICRIDPTLPDFFIGDAARLGQILINLLGNAVKFTPEGMVSLLVDGHETVDGYWRLRLRVRDTGIGIAVDALERLFKPFSQEDSSTTRRFGGSGLGLAISKRLAELMNGGITVVSSLGSGSTFDVEVELPVAPEKLQGSAVILNRVELERLAVLVVDDNELNLRVLEEVLANWGIGCRKAGSGPEAIRLWEEEGPFDLLITDHQMADMDGHDLAGHLRGLENAANSKFVLLSSESMNPVDFRDCFDEITSKPIWPATLQSILGRLFPGSISSTDPGAAKERLQSYENLSSLRVLVAEDNPTNRKVIQLLLKRLGIEPAVVGDGRQAVEEVLNGNYDLVLLDIQMPVMDGLEACRQIHAANLPERPRLIALTANAFQEDRDAAEAAGMDGYLAKPVTLVGLRDALAAHMPAASC